MPECTEKNWTPNIVTTPFIYKSGVFAYSTQSWLWYTDSMNALKAKGGSYIYEVRRSIDVWDFVRPGFLCLYCITQFSTNLPDIWPTFNTQQEEEDFWLRLCCLLWGNHFIPLISGNEESELRTYPVSSLNANKWYTTQFKFYRKKKDRSFTLWTESEWCGGHPITFCNLGQDFEWCRMTTNTFTS